MAERATSSDDELVALPGAEPSLRPWVGHRLAGTGSFRVARITSGLCNELFLIQRGGHGWVVRQAPRVGATKGDHDIGPEHRI
jgi:hypothetical protein